MGLFSSGKSEASTGFLDIQQIQKRLGREFDTSPDGDQSRERGYADNSGIPSTTAPDQNDGLEPANAPPAEPVIETGLTGSVLQPLETVFSNQDVPDAVPEMADGPVTNSPQSQQPDTPAETVPEPIPVPLPEHALDETLALGAGSDHPGQEQAPIAASKEKPKRGRSRDIGKILADGIRIPPRIMVTSLIINLMGMALPLAILQVYDRILPNLSYGTLTYLTVGLIVIFTIEASLKIFRSYLMGWDAVHHGFHSQVGAVSKLLNTPRSQTGKHSPTIWLDGFEALGELSAFEGGQSRVVLVDIPLAAIFLVVIGLIGGPLVLVPIAVIAIFGGLALPKGARLQEALANRSNQDNKQSDFLVECLSGIHTLKALAIEPQILRRFERLQKSSAVASFETIIFGNKLQSHGTLFASLMMISIVSCGAMIVMTGHLSIGELACCSLLSGRLTQPVLRGIGTWTEIQNIQLALERTAKFDDLTPVDAQEDSTVVTVRGAIKLENVAFSYKGEDRSFLHDLTLDIQPGEFIGVRGEDGSGRSTLARLIIGALPPQQGTVTIDGIPATSFQNRDLKQNIGYVSANSAIFKGTILENITMFRMGDTVEAARDACRLIGLEDDINLLPDGFDTMLGQRGVEALSSGLLQRVAIARALVSRPKILIFNEANSLMDFRSDELLREGLASLRGEMTTIIFSNRPSFLKIANRVFELRDGSLMHYQPAPPLQQPELQKSIA
jgi:ATP-binding cassette subfamily C protein LapB